jgi:hypothetical protein
MGSIYFKRVPNHFTSRTVVHGSGFRLKLIFNEQVKDVYGRAEAEPVTPEESKKYDEIKYDEVVYE